MSSSQEERCEHSDLRKVDDSEKVEFGGTLVPEFRCTSCQELFYAYAGGHPYRPSARPRSGKNVAQG